ncbi:M23 family metallopeptidase [Candidatus Falkowbacteria bacterium]|jgi:murein DD-endopeptidase MepM/ murein hydrolase activator NlpD|nr:M23 family metallopeptidase [Candidatus Falkowbacteria bacterium]MBT5502934.1 M23 family metallopeptidase [Candidatus Falkowbacteria bacterium]MBT7500421.1 M23 family metallopeptidase [Candidatus Falkowbacteria bacterium]
MQIKRIFIKILAGFFRGFATLSRSVFARCKFITRFFETIGKGVFRYLFFPVYRLFYIFKYKVLNIYAPAHSKVYYILNKTYLVHVVIVVIGLAVVVNSINAQELREGNFGERTIIYSVVTKELMEELTEETQIVETSDQVLSYLDNTASVGSSGGSESDILASDQLVTEFSTITEGGAAVVKPNIIEPIKIEDLPQVTTPSRSRIIEYTVLPGETVSAIAEKFNISVETILWQNNLGVRSLIRPGDDLEILPTSGIAHKVSRGENIGSIAKKYNVESEKIVSYNNLFDVNDIKIGQYLIIAGGKKISPYISKPSYAGSVPSVSPISKLFIPPSQNVVSSGMLWPTSVRRISQYYSWRHTGLDIAGPKGTPLYASESGKVTYSGWSNGYGYNVMIDHGNGTKTRYAHASKLYVSKGDSVVKGQTIAAMGSTGWSTGSHIHFEVIVSGGKKNPLSYVK